MANRLGVSMNQRIREDKTVWVVRWRELLEEEGLGFTAAHQVVGTSFDAIGVAWLKRQEAPGGGFGDPKPGTPAACRSSPMGSLPEAVLWVEGDTRRRVE